jgi:DNA-binding XRE family transcriptional regulator
VPTRPQEQIRLAIVGRTEVGRIEMCRRVKLWGPWRAGLYFVRTPAALFTVVVIDVYCRAQHRRGGRLPEKDVVVTPDELLSALKRYLAESGDAEEAVASQIGVNRHTLRRWLSDRQSPKKGKLALAAAFLRHAGYL